MTKDKSPYKTATGAHFQLGGKGVHGPGYYLHLEPGTVFLAGGMWMPDAKALQTIRERIADRPAEWTKAHGALDHPEDALKRPPRGFDPAHPMIEDIKRRSFTSSVTVTRKKALAPDFMDTFIDGCTSIAPLMKFLAGAVGVRW